MTVEELLEQLENGTCPFTGEPYSCARCKHEPQMRNATGNHTLHISLDITAPLFRSDGWDEILEWFPPGDRCAIHKGLARLLQLGVNTVPLQPCDFNHFCFRHGCIGHTEGS